MAENTIEHDTNVAAPPKRPARLRGGAVGETGRRNNNIVHRDTTVVARPSPIIPQTVSDDRPRKPPVAIVSFLLLVILPFLAVLYYYQAMASNQYTSEARFAVRSLSGDPGDTSARLGGSRGLISLSSLSQDAYVVTSFIHSDEILRRIGEKVDLRSYFTGDDIDVLSRLPADASGEEFLDYWSNHVSTYVDGPSGIITLYVRAFSPETSRKLASLITTESEILVNELSARARQDIVKRAQAEVEKREAGYRQSLNDLSVYQNSSGILSPEAAATDTGTLLTGLMAQKLDVDSRLFVLRQNVDADAPNAAQLEKVQQSLQNQIDKLRTELAANDSVESNLSNALKQFSVLETNRTLAEGLYSASRRNLDTAQFEAIRKAVYVTTFVPPTSPEESRYPKRLATPFLVLLGLGMLWSTLALAWASIDDHRF